MSLCAYAFRLRSERGPEVIESALIVHQAITLHCLALLSRQTLAEPCKQRALGQMLLQFMSSTSNAAAAEVVMSLPSSITTCWIQIEIQEQHVHLHPV